MLHDRSTEQIYNHIVGYIVSSSTAVKYFLLMIGSIKFIYCQSKIVNKLSCGAGAEWRQCADVRSRMEQLGLLNFCFYIESQIAQPYCWCCGISLRLYLESGALIAVISGCARRGHWQVPALDPCTSAFTDRPITPSAHKSRNRACRILKLTLASHP